MNALIPTETLKNLTSSLPARKVEQIRLWCEICEAFLAEPPLTRKAAASRFAIQYAGRISGGISLKTIYRRAAEYRDRGVLSLIPPSSISPASASNIASNIVFLTYWHGLVQANQRASRPAFRQLIAKLESGVNIPGYGTWRDIYRAENPQRSCPDICPYRIGTLLPAGWSCANLNRHKPNKWALRALRIGPIAASTALPQVLRTRAGLSRGQIVEIDDMWHDVKVRYGNHPAERCIELAMIDVATGYRSYILKPIRKREDSTRELILPRMMPYLISYWLVVQGYRSAGALICGEHATAAVGKRLAAEIENVTGGKVKFSSGGLASTPLIKGLYDGRPRGNFKFKARLESSHSLVHNELASTVGQVGYTRETAPEDLYGRDATEKSLMRQCDQLIATDSSLPDQIRFPYMTYAAYAAEVSAAIARINDRTDHALEGWDEQGFIVGSWRTGAREPWRDLSELGTLPPAVMDAFRHELELHPENVRARRLSPKEAWEKRASDVIRAGRWTMPILLGDSLSMTATVNEKMELKIKDSEIDLSATVVAIVNDDGKERLLERGTSYKIWVNPLEPSIAYIATTEGQYLGIAPVSLPSHQDDEASLHQALGIRSKVQSLERAAILPLLEEKAAKVKEDAQYNDALLTRARASRDLTSQTRKPSCTAPAFSMQRACIDDLL
ncbi:MAG: hypothetical protein RR996_03065 [Alistipes sp.]